jgi:hypothetical protein
MRAGSRPAALAISEKKDRKPRVGRTPAVRRRLRLVSLRRQATAAFFVKLFHFFTCIRWIRLLTSCHAQHLPSNGASPGSR